MLYIRPYYIISVSFLLNHPNTNFFTTIHKFIYSFFISENSFFLQLKILINWQENSKIFSSTKDDKMNVLNVKMLVPLMILPMMVFIVPADYVDPSSYHLECYVSIQHGDEKINYTSMDCGDSVRVFKCGKVTCKGPDKISSLNINLEIFIFFSGTWLFCTLLMIIR